MEDINKVIKTVKETVTVDNIVSLMKDVKVIDDKRLKEEDVRKTLSNLDINKYVDVDEIKKQAQHVAEQSKETIMDLQEQSSKMISYATESFKDFNMFKVLSKAEALPDSKICTNVKQPDAMAKHELESYSSNIPGEVERREEDATKTEGQGKQSDVAASPNMESNLGVSDIQFEDLPKTET